MTAFYLKQTYKKFLSYQRTWECPSASDWEPYVLSLLNNKHT